MTTAYTTLLGLALPVEGELTGTWGTTVNDSITQLLDDAIAGTATASVTYGNWTLNDDGFGAPNQARCAILIATGTPGVSRNIIAPARSKGYFVVNQSDAAVVLKGASTTGISISSGKSGLVVWNGSDFVAASGTVISVSGTAPVSVANGTTTPTISMPAATTSVNGYLTSTDWTTFNNKGYKNIPQSGSDKVTAYTLASTDIGKYIGVGASGSIVVPNATYSDSVAIANGDAISVFNNTSGNITLTMSITTAYIGGTDTDKATITLATRGIATILFVSSTVCVVTGNVS